MAEYDPTAPATFDSENDAGNDGEYQFDAADAGDEDDDDYDPSSFNFDAGAEDAQDTDATLAHEPVPVPDATESAQNENQPKPKTVGGFIVDDDDEEEEEQATVPPPSQLNGTEGAQSGQGAVAVAEASTPVVPIASDAQDTAAVLPAQLAQSAPLNGSAPVISVTDPDPASASSLSAAQVSFPQSTQSPAPAADQGKQQMPLSTTTLSAPQSATATPLPHPTNGTTSQANASAPQTTTTQRLPHDKVGQLEDRIKDDPRGDTEAWRSLISHYREKDQLDNVRKVYSRFFDVFPSAAPMWVEYAQLELEHNELRNVEQIFGLSLLQLPNVDMWNVYLDYLRRIHPLINDTDGSKRGILSQAFELLLDNVGIDPDAGKLWREYIDFIESGPGTIGGTGWQDAQKMDLLRKAYQRAVKLPHSELTKLWKEYDNFELRVNKATGRKYLQEQSPHYMTARTAKTQLDHKIEGLDRTSLPKMPPLWGCAGDQQFADQTDKWRAWISWEKEDPMVFKEEDLAMYRKRVLYAYKQATMQLRFYQDIWFEASSWCFEQGTEDMIAEGDKLLDAGTEACPESVLLALKKADRLEGSLDAGNTDEITVRNGERLDPVFENCHKALYALHKKMQERLSKDIAQVQEDYAKRTPDEQPEADDDENEEGSAAEKPKTNAQKMKEDIDARKASFAAYQEELKKTISCLWVAKMRAFRRIQGQGHPKKPPKGLRGVFDESRPRGQLTSEVYIAAALMEWNVYRDASANKIFERGARLFPLDAEFVLEYIKHLIATHDYTNARAVFETFLTKVTGTTSLTPEKQREKCRPLLGFMHSFESKYGDLDKIHRLERRMSDMFPHEPEIVRFCNRLSVPDFDVTEVQLIISPTQALPKSADQQQPMQSIEDPSRGLPPGSSHLQLGPNGPYIGSPKRPLDDSDSEAPQRKFLRGDSPLKGAAGRRMQNQAGGPAPAAVTGGGGSGFVTKNYVPGAAPPLAAPMMPIAPVGPPPLPDKINWLLGLIPNAKYYQSTRFDSQKMVEYLRGVDLGRARI